LSITAVVDDVGIVVWLVGCAFALWKGETMERAAGATLLIAWLASTVAWGAAKHHTTFAVLLIDLVAFAVLAGIAWKSTRAWPIWAAALMAMQTVTEIVYTFNLGIGAQAYDITQWTASSGVIGALIVGTFIAWREREALKSFQGELTV
jgi:hypothetical protein